jgi:hypothetical protein
MKKIFAIFVMALFLVSMMPLVTADNIITGKTVDTGFLVEAQNAETMEKCIEILRDEFPDRTRDMLKRECVAIREKEAITDATSLRDKLATTDAISEEKLRTLTDEQRKRLAILSAEKLEALKDLEEDELERMASLRDYQLRVISRLRADYVEKVADLSDEELEKIKYFDRSRLREISAKSPEAISEELTKYRLEKIEEELRFRKRVIANHEEKLREANQKFLRAVKNYDEAREEFLEERAAFDAAVTDDDDTRAIEHAKKFLIRAADMIIESLEKIKAKTEANEDLTEEEAEDILSDIAERIEKLEDAKAKVEAATTKEEVKEAGAVILEEWRNAKKKMNRYTYQIVRGNVQEILQRSEQLEKKLDRILAYMEEQGIEVANIDTKVDLFSDRIAEAREKFQTGEDLFRQARETGDSTLIRQAKAYTKEAHNALREAHNILMDIWKEIREAGGSPEDVEDEVEEYEIEEETITAAQADEAISKAKLKYDDALQAVTAAQEEGKDVTEAAEELEEAKERIDKAVLLYGNEKYDEAYDKALSALEKIEDALEELTETDDDDDNETNSTG